MSPRVLFTAALVSAASLLTGCHPAASLVAGQIFSAPNKRAKTGLEYSPEVQRVARQAYADTFDVQVTGARVHVAIVEPGHYDFHWAPRINGASVSMDGPIHFEAERSGRPPRGTILMLHGFGLCKEQMLPWAIELAGAGYRIALVDLRGHGDSSGEWVGFGALEKRDLAKVVDAMETRGLGGAPLGVFGISYGASVGLGFAAEDRRVRTVVALEPFSSAETAIPELARAAFPKNAAHISDQMFTSAFSIGANRGLFNWAETDTTRSVDAIPYPILFIHGEADTWLSPEHSRRLFDRAKPGSMLTLVPNETHVSLPLSLDRISQEVCNWFDSRLAAEARPHTAHPRDSRPL